MVKELSLSISKEKRMRKASGAKGDACSTERNAVGANDWCFLPTFHPKLLSPIWHYAAHSEESLFSFKWYRKYFHRHGPRHMLLIWSQFWSSWKSVLAVISMVLKKQSKRLLHIHAWWFLVWPLITFLFCPHKFCHTFY